MSAPILATKLYVPPPRSGIVPRLRLIERLDDGLAKGRRLTLISASAGFGKTTLVSEWITGCGRSVAWLSLDEGDHDPARFITYLITALQIIKAGIGESLLATLQSPQPLQIETILTTLLNEISTIQEPFLLVLDDYHSVDSQQVDQALAFLIEHQPPQMHLVIATRDDPSLPLARLRARSQCTELRVADLRFTPAEAAEFLNRAMGLNLSEDNVASLETRTEGWIAGLQLAAISMQGQPDPGSFIHSFTGSHRFVMDYLLEEVLQQQPENVRSFLLRTSVLDRMCGSLCDAGFPDSSAPGQSTLEYLEHANLFIIPLDNERRWYRYHHLFADLLRKRVGQNLGPEEIAELHIHASQWYENNDLMLDAFHHAAAANDIERAIRLMEHRKMPLHRRGTATAILDWLESLSDAVRNARPVLWWMQATLMLTIGQTIGVEEKLQAAENSLGVQTVPDAELDLTTRDLIGKIAVIRANLAQADAQTDTILVQARRALEYLHPNNLPYRSSAIRTLGFAHYWQDDWDQARQAYAEALSLAQTAGDIPSTMLALVRLGQLQEDQNQLNLAVESYQQALNLIGEYSNPNTTIAYLGLAEIFYQWNNLDTAEQYAKQGLKLAQQYDQITDRIIMSELHLALIKLAQGDVSGAAQMVSQAEQTSRQKYFTLRLPNIAFFQAWIHLHQGNLDAAAQLTRQSEIPLMRARVLIRQNESAAALEVLETLRQHAEAKGLARRLLDVMAVQSVALYAQGEKEKAIALLGEALTQAEPAGFIRLFVDEGEAMRLLMLDVRSVIENQQHSGVHPLLGYVDRILVAFPESMKTISQSKMINPKPEIANPLSERELEVLRLLRSELSGPEIAERLIVSLNTLRTHTKNIFNKLGVNSRRAAIHRAEELDLF